VVLAVIAGCNTRTPVHDRDVFATAPTEWANATVPKVPGGELATVVLSPAVAIGGEGGRGTVFVDAPAAEGGVTVALSSTVHDVVRVTPSVVTVPAGSFSTNFSYATASVTRDADVSIIASTPGRSRSARVSVWAAVLPSLYFHIADRDDLLHGAQISRVTSDMNARFEASCSGNVVRASVIQGSTVTHSLSFAAAGFQLVRPGVVYDNATPNGSGHHMRVALFAPSSCAGVGRFQVHDLSINARGDVTNFWVSFEAGCPGVPGIVRGAFRMTTLRATVNPAPCRS
jgi:hypothetical protein